MPFHFVPFQQWSVFAISHSRPWIAYDIFIVFHRRPQIIFVHAIAISMAGRAIAEILLKDRCLFSFLIKGPAETGFQLSLFSLGFQPFRHSLSFIGCAIALRCPIAVIQLFLSAGCIMIHAAT